MSSSMTLEEKFKALIKVINLFHILIKNLATDYVNQGHLFG